MKINIRQKENNLNNEFEILYNNELKYIAKVPSVSIDNPLKIDDLRKIRVNDLNNNIVYTTNYNYSLKKNEKYLPFNFLITGEQTFNQLLFVTKNKSIKIYYEVEDENDVYIIDVNGKRYNCYSVSDGYIRHFPIYYREKQVAEILKSNLAASDEYVCYIQKEYKIIRDGVALLALYLDRSEYNYAYIRDRSSAVFDEKTSSKYYDKKWVKTNFDSAFFDEVDKAIALFREEEKRLKKEKRSKAKKEKEEKKTKAAKEKKKTAESKKTTETKEKKTTTKKKTTAKTTAKKKTTAVKTRKPRLKKSDLIEEIKETLDKAEEKVSVIPEEPDILSEEVIEKPEIVSEEPEVVSQEETQPEEQPEEIETILEKEQEPEVTEEGKKKKKKFSFWKLWIISIFLIIILLVAAYYLNAYRMKIKKEEEAKAAEKIITGEVYIKILSIDSAKVTKDESTHKLQVEGKMKLSFSEEKHYDVTMWGYCLGDEGEKYIIFGPDNEAKSYHDGGHKFTLVNTVNSESGDVIYKDGTTKKFEEIPWDNVRIKSCKIEKLISYEKLKDNITVKSTKKLNFEKEIKKETKK